MTAEAQAGLQVLYLVLWLVGIIVSIALISAIFDIRKTLRAMLKLQMRASGVPTNEGIKLRAPEFKLTAPPRGVTYVLLIALGLVVVVWILGRMP